jgi:hypothetical protein
VFLDYIDARKFVRKLNFNKQKDWFEYSKSGNRPDNIPGNPRDAYISSGWKGWDDFLGIETKVQNKKFLEYEEARAILKNLELKTVAEWIAYRKSGVIPKNIPSNPNVIYKESGWKGWDDFLGKEK